MTLQEIGERFGISRERVRQIETRLKRRLKEFIEASAPDVEVAPSLAFSLYPIAAGRRRLR